MKKIVLIAPGVLTLTLAAFILSRTPFPDSKARDAVGTAVTYTHNDSSVTYYVSGPEEFQGSVILHASAGREASDFNELVGELNKADYRTIAVEAVGINGTSLYEDSRLLHMIEPMIKAYSKGSRAKRVHLIGHAYGNRVVRMYALKFPDRVSSVTLLAAGGQNEIDPLVEQKLRDIFNPLLSTRQRHKNIADIFFAEGNEIPKHWKRGWHIKTAIAQGKAKGLDLDNDWQGAGGVPMLVVQPAQDRIAAQKDTSDVLLARYPDQVEVVVIENAGHALLPEQPEAVAKAVIEHLNRMSGE